MKWRCTFGMAQPAIRLRAPPTLHYGPFKGEAVGAYIYIMPLTMTLDWSPNR